MINSINCLIITITAGYNPVLFLGLCGLRHSLSNTEPLQYVMCSSYFANCGALQHYVYNIITREIERWTSTRKQEGGVKVEYFCDITIQFDYDVVLRAYQEHRDQLKDDPIFDAVRFEAR